MDRNPKQSKREQKKSKQKSKEQERSRPKTKHQAQRPQQQEQEEQVQEDLNLNRLEQGQEEVQVGFVLREPVEEMYHSLKTILTRYSTITNTRPDQLASAVLERQKLAVVTTADDDDSDQDEQEQQEDEQQDDEENVYSVLTILTGEVARLLKKKAASAAGKDMPDRETIVDILKKKKTGVLLNQRLPNLHAEIAKNAHQVFKKDLLELKQQNNEAFQQLCGGYILSISEVEEEKKGSQGLIYSNFEDYEMTQRAAYSWLGGNNPSNHPRAVLKNLYYLIKTEEYFKGVDKLGEYLEQ